MLLNTDDIEAQRHTVDAMSKRATVFETPCGDGTMVWREWGTGTPLVLFHGGFGSWRHWIKNIETLSARYRVLAPDTPGLGDSALPPQPATPESLGSIVARGLTELCPEDSIDFVAFSFGGVVAGQVALRLGSRVRSLTLCGSGGMGLKRQEMRLIRRTDDMSDAEKFEANISNMKSLMLYDHDNIDPLAAFIHMENDSLARLRSRRMSLGNSLAEALVDIGKHGTVLNGIWGEQDITATPWIDDRRAMLKSLSSDSQFRSIANAGHWVSFEAADTFNRTLLEFLD